MLGVECWKVDMLIVVWLGQADQDNGFTSSSLGLAWQGWDVIQLIWGLKGDHREKLVLDTKIPTTIRHIVTVAMVRILSYHRGRERKMSRMSRTGTDHPGSLTADLYIWKLKNLFQSLCLSGKTCKVIIFKMSFSTDWPLCVEVSTRLAVMLLLLSDLLNTVYLLCH